MTNGVSEAGSTGGSTGSEAALQPWLEQVEQSVRGSEVLKGIKGGVNELAKNHIKISEDYGKLHGEHETLKGSVKEMVKIPGKDATPEELKAFNTRLGVPDKPEAYEFAPGKVPNDDGIVKWARELFYGLNVPKPIGDAIGSAFNKFMDAVVDEEDRLATEAFEKANKDFRATFPDENSYNAALELSARFWNKLVGEDFKIFQEATGIGNHPVLIKFILETAKKMGEDTSPAGTGGTPKVGEGMIYDKTPELQK